ncbi:MAG: hypothetical protein CVV64_00870 [Candidatus Wallbacteria bacterium HGW-Wallbacteria-1]|jgi:flagellar protein FlaG|uniref:Flagellar biosynthesis protein FlaG n=1 Tax=Candidatus Wallbacteria bacterium HGW-Wallbacteria-1 TaxID=2013854 RepID=A0A2N1PUH9_9BACT|nr:MAG: hypothetical protein CVV64_00870 [Candidatus Wallbacteria bacterium HGW-Wallbacteria-1]
MNSGIIIKGWCDMDVNKLSQAGDSRAAGVRGSLLSGSVVPAASNVRTSDAAAAPVKSAEAEKPVILDMERLQASADSFNRVAQAMDRSLDFSIDRNSNTVVVKVVNRQTDEVIREVPARDFLDFVDKMHDFLGLMFDEQA